MAPYTVKVKDESVHALLLGLHEDDQIEIVQWGDWEEIGDKEYNEVEILKDATEEFERGDFAQANEKLWLCASYNVKTFCLGLNVKLTSHDAKKYAVATLIDHAKTTKFDGYDLIFCIDYSLAGILKIGWNQANNCHTDFNELLPMDKKQWEYKYDIIADFSKALIQLKHKEWFTNGFKRMLLNENGENENQVKEYRITIQPTEKENLHFGNKKKYLTEWGIFIKHS